MSPGNPYFRVCEYKVTSERTQSGTSTVQAIVEVKVGHKACVRRAAQGVGPVHALDNALRACLAVDFPDLERVRLSDYRVSVADSEGTGSKVRVIIQATDGDSSWDAGCVSANIIEASFEALCSATVMGLMRARGPARVAG